MKIGIFNKEKAITLIALIVTIIILLILAGVSISAITSENGVINKAKMTAFITEMNQIEENVKIKESEIYGEEIVNNISRNLFDTKLKDKQSIEIADSLKKEILYARDDMPVNKSPDDYDPENFELDDYIYIIDKKTGDNKEDTYIYDEQTEKVFKIPQTKIAKKIYHSYGVAILGKGVDAPDEEIDENIIEDESEVIEVGEIKYYEPDLTGFNKTTTKIIYYTADFTAYTECSVDDYIANSKPNTLNNRTFYDYKNKIWANIKTNARGLDAWWVWVPRYAYKIENNKSSIIYVDTSNKQFDGTNLPEGYQVNSAFTVGTKELKGIWMSKYDASFVKPTTTGDVLAPDMTGFDANNTYIELFDKTTQTYSGIKLADANLSTVNSSNEWYDYNNKVWANIKTSAHDLDAWWVWIPRYAYRVEADGKVNILFVDLKNKPLDTINYPERKLPEGYVIADCFDVDGNRLAGIWMSKYDVSYVEVTQEQESENANNIIYKNAD